MSISIKTAIKNGDSKRNSIKSTVITQKIKAVLKSAYDSDKNTSVLNINEIHDAVLSICNDTEVLQIAQTTDKSLYDTNGKLKIKALFVIRCNDLVTNSLKNAVKNGYLIERTHDNGIAHFYYNVVENVHETVAKTTKKAKQ